MTGTVSHETVEAEYLFAVSRQMRAIEQEGYRVTKIRVARIGVQGLPTSYITGRDGVVLVHPRDWGPAWRHALTTFRPFTETPGRGGQESFWGVPVEIEGQR